MQRETFDMTFVTGLKNELQAAPPSTSKLSKADVLRALLPELKRLRDEKDYTLEALVELLGVKGLHITVSTLQGAFKKKGSAKKTKTTSDPPAALALPEATKAAAPTKTKAA